MDNNKDNDQNIEFLEKAPVNPRPTFVQQPTPHNLSRYVIFVVYLMCYACSCTYYSWFSFSDYLLVGKKFQWLCTSDEIASNPSIPLKCLDQKRAIHISLDLIRAIDFSLSLPASIISDWIKPNLVVILGVIFAICGWFIMSLAQNSFLMYLSMIFIGFASSFLCFPMLNISNLFFDCSSLAISALIYIGESVSQSTPFILKYVILSMGNSDSSFFRATNFYIGFFLSLCLIGSIICVPSRPFLDQIDLLGPQIDDERQKIITNAAKRFRLKRYFMRDTTKHSLFDSFKGAKMHVSILYLTCVVMVAEFFNAYIFEKYHTEPKTMFYSTIISLVAPCINIPIGIAHDMGYSHVVLIIYHIVVFIMCLLVKYCHGSSGICLGASLVIIIFRTLQENGIILYVENNYRTKYLSTLVSLLYTGSGFFEFTSLMFKSIFHLKVEKVDIILPVMTLSIIPLVIMACLYKSTKFTDEIYSDDTSDV